MTNRIITSNITARTKIKLCGLSRAEDIKAANALQSDYIGFVFAKKSKRYVAPEQAAELKKSLAPGIKAVGVFVNDPPEAIAKLLTDGVIDIAQLHGTEDEEYIQALRSLTAQPYPIIQAFRITTAADLAAAERSTAEYVLLDSGAGTGTVFDWSLLQNMDRPYFLAGGLSPDNVAAAVAVLHPFAVDVSSGIETDGVKDKTKMAAFVAAVRKEDCV